MFATLRIEHGLMLWLSLHAVSSKARLYWPLLALDIVRFGGDDDVDGKAR